MIKRRVFCVTSLGGLHLEGLIRGGAHFLNFTVIDLFGLYILFFHFRPRDATRGNSFFQMSSYARANLRITNEKKQKENSYEGITWSEIGKQNVQAEKVYCGCVDGVSTSRQICSFFFPPLSHSYSANFIPVP